MPVVRLVGEAIFVGDEACKSVETYKMSEAAKGNPAYFVGERKEKVLAERREAYLTMQAAFHASSRARDVDLAVGKKRIADLGNRIDAARKKNDLPDEIPPRSMMMEQYGINRL